MKKKFIFSLNLFIFNLIFNEATSCNNFVTDNFNKVITISKANTVKPVYKGHPWDPKIEAVVDRSSLFRGSLYYKN